LIKNMVIYIHIYSIFREVLTYIILLSYKNMFFIIIFLFVYLYFYIHELSTMSHLYSLLR